MRGTCARLLSLRRRRSSPDGRDHGGVRPRLSEGDRAARVDSVRSLYDTLLSTMKDGRRLGQSGRYARLAPAEYIVSADSSRLMHQRGCAERIGVPIKFIHIAQILNGAAE